MPKGPVRRDLTGAQAYQSEEPQRGAHPRGSSHPKRQRPARSRTTRRRPGMSESDSARVLTGGGAADRPDVSPDEQAIAHPCHSTGGRRGTAWAPRLLPNPCFRRSTRAARRCLRSLSGAFSQLPSGLADASCESSVKRSVGAALRGNVQSIGRLVSAAAGEAQSVAADEGQLRGLAAPVHPHAER
jgi:hypothetical protein